MTDDQLQNKADILHALFNNMPNCEERELHFRSWLLIRKEQSKRIYWGHKNEIIKS